MSFTSEPNYNDFIDRLELILTNSALLFPKTIGAVPDSEDLINQVIKYDLAIPQDVPTGLGPPHIFIGTALNPIVSDDTSGRYNRTEFGPRTMTLEFWAVCVASGVEFRDSQQNLFNITQAVKQTLGLNIQLRDLAGANPLSIELERLIVTPFTNWAVTEKTTIANTIVIRPKTFVNLRTT